MARAPSAPSLAEAVLDNPIIRREALPRMLRRASRAVWTALGVGSLSLSLLLGIYLATKDYGFIIGYAAVYGWAAFSVLLSGLHCARAIAYEREIGTWDALIMSRLAGPGIVLGKLLGTLLPMWALGTLLLPMALVASLTPGAEAALPVLYGYGGALLATTSFGSVGLYCSMMSRSVNIAQFLTVVLSVGILIFASLASSVLGIIMWAWTEFGAVASALVHGMIVLLPGFAALWVLMARFDRIEAARRK
jgi:hypothetical protein